MHLLCNQYFNWTKQRWVGKPNLNLFLSVMAGILSACCLLAMVTCVLMRFIFRFSMEVDPDRKTTTVIANPGFDESYTVIFGVETKQCEAPCAWYAWTLGSENNVGSGTFVTGWTRWGANSIKWQISENVKYEKIDSNSVKISQFKPVLCC